MKAKRKQRSNRVASDDLLGAAAFPKIELPSSGLGTYRTSGTMIGLLLQLEEEQGVSVLVYTAKQLGYTLEEITEVWNDTTCKKCGMSMRLHKQTGGKCW